VTSSTPDRPTRIESTDIPNVPSGSTITDVDPPKNGTAEVRNGDVIYTPDPGFIGEERISVTVVTPTGETQTTVVTVAVGKEQKIITRWTPPKKLVNGMNHFAPGTLMTNAMQPVKVSVKCELILRNISGNPAPKCSVIAGKEGTYISVKAYDPTAVIVTLSAPKKGAYRAFTQELVYRVNP